MKKQKIQKQSNPISLSAKKNIPKHQQLFTPYKIQWKDQNYPLKNMQNASNTKNFYINMKSELMSIKNDVAKMMKKQSENNSQNDKTPVKTISIKNKCQMGSKKYKNQDSLKIQYQSLTNVYRNRANSINGIFNYADFKNQKQQINIQAEQIQVNLKDFKVTNPEKIKKDINNQNFNSKKDFNKFVYLQQTTQIKDSNKNVLKQKIEQSCLLEQSDSNIQKEKQLCQYKIQVQQKFKDKVHSLIKKEQLNISGLQSLTNNEDLIKKEESKNQDKIQIKQLKGVILSLQQKLFKSDQNFIFLKQRFESLNDMYQKQQTTFSNLKQQLQQKLRLKEQELIEKNNHISRLNEECQHSIKQNQNSSQKQLLQAQLKKTVQYARKLQMEHFKQQNQIEQFKHSLQQLENQKKFLKQQIKIINTQFQNKFNNLQIQSIQKQKTYDQQLQKYTELQQNSKFKDNKIYLYQQQLSNIKQQLKKAKNQILKQKSLIEDQCNQKQQRLATQSDIKRNAQINKKSEAQSNKKNFAENIQKYTAQNYTLQLKICKLSQQVEEQNKTIQILHKQNIKLKQETKLKLEQSLCKSSSNLELGNQISQKFNQYIDQNYRLKNQISHLKCKLEEINIKNSLLVQQVTLYEQKSNKSDSKRLAIEDWQMKNEQLQKVQLQRDQLSLKNQQLNQFYQIQFMRKQNKIEQLQIKLNYLKSKLKDHELSFCSQQTSLTELFPNISNGISFLQTYKVLLDEVKSLKQDIISLKQKQSKLKFQLKQYQNTINLLKGSYTQTRKDQEIIQLRQKLENKKNYIRNTIMDKINKSENQNDIQYFIDQLKYYFEDSQTVYKQINRK